jgi:hypothetical protein
MITEIHNLADRARSLLESFDSIRVPADATMVEALVEFVEGLQIKEAARAAKRLETLRALEHVRLSGPPECLVCRRIRTSRAGVVENNHTDDCIIGMAIYGDPETTDIEKVHRDAAAMRRAGHALLASLGEFVRQSMHANPEWRSGIVDFENALRGDAGRAVADEIKSLKKHNAGLAEALREAADCYSAQNDLIEELQTETGHAGDRDEDEEEAERATRWRALAATAATVPPLVPVYIVKVPSNMSPEEVDRIAKAMATSGFHGSPPAFIEVLSPYGYEEGSPLVYSNDGKSICACCGEDLKEPHPWRACAARLDRFEKQNLDKLLAEQEATGKLGAALKPFVDFARTLKPLPLGVVMPYLESETVTITSDHFVLAARVFDDAFRKDDAPHG